MPSAGPHRSLANCEEDNTSTRCAQGTATDTDLAARDVGLRSRTEGIDTTTSAGRLVFHVFGALAELERELIRERTVAGLAAARARGRTGERPRAMTREKLAVARQMYDSKGTPSPPSQ